MKTFVLNPSGFELPGLSARELGTLFHQGMVERATPCRPSGDSVWSTVDDIFPMLKYQPRQCGLQLTRSAGRPIRRAAAKLLAAASFDDLVRFLGRPSSPV